MAAGPSTRAAQALEGMVAVSNEGNRNHEYRLIRYRLPGSNIIGDLGDSAFVPRFIGRKINPTAFSFLIDYFDLNIKNFNNHDCVSFTYEGNGAI